MDKIPKHEKHYYKKIKHKIKKLEKEIKMLEENILHKLKKSQAKQLQKFINELKEEIDFIIEENLTSSYYATFLQSTLNVIDTSFNEVARQYMNQEIELLTTGGTLNGEIMEINLDHLVLKEKFGFSVLVPYIHILGITTKGE